MAIAQGRCLVGVNTSDNDFKTPEKTGGEKTHKLTVAEMPSHSHKYINGQTGSLSWADGGIWIGDGTYTTVNFSDISSTGGNQSHNNLQPYFTCYIWKRTA